jgi:hypothetical protein
MDLLFIPLEDQNCDKVFGRKYLKDKKNDKRRI